MKRRRTPIASQWEEPARRLVIAWSQDKPEAEELCTTEALRIGRLLLCDAITMRDKKITVRRRPLYLAAWLFWCRWQALPAGEDRASLETSIRLFTLLVMLDQHGFGAQENLPEDLRTVIEADALSVDEVMVDEARSLLDALTEAFDATAVRLVRGLTDAALVLIAKGDPGRADYLSNLAAALMAAYHGSGQEHYLLSAVDACRTAVAEAPPGPVQVPHLVNLAIGLNAVFEANGDGSALREALDRYDALHPSEIDDSALRARALSAYSAATFAMAELTFDSAGLDRAVDLCRAAVTASAQASATGQQDPRYVANLAEMLRVRYELDGHPNDLQEAARSLEALLLVTPAEDPDRPRRMAALASVLFASETSALERPAGQRPVELCEAALRQMSATDRLRPGILTNLSTVLLSRHLETGNLRDLRRAVAAARLALSASASHPKTSEMRGNLGNALVAWYDRTGRPELLDRGIEEISRALHGGQLERPRRVDLMSNLGAALFARTNRTGSDDDLATAIEVNRAALELTAPGCSDRSRRLANLALCLEQSFDRHGDPAALDEAIETYRTACAVAANTGRQRSHHLSAMATALVVRHWLRASSGDLEEAVELHRQSITALPAGHADRSRRMANLASALLSRHRSGGNPADASEAVEQMETALGLVPEGDADRPYRLNTLGLALTRLASDNERRETCDEAVEFLIRAVAATPEGDLALEARLRHLGDALELRYRLAGEPDDLDAAVRAHRGAADNCPPDYPDRALDLYNLGSVIAARAEQREQSGDSAGARDDRDSATLAYQAASTTARATVMVRLAAADQWARLMLATGHLATSVDAFTLAVGLLPQLSWRGLGQADQERLLTEWIGLTGDACAAAIEAGQPQRAVELLDAGRSILWEHQLELRTDASALADQRPDLASRLSELCASIRALENDALAADENSAWSRSDEPSRARQGQLMSLSRRLDELIDEIRQVDGQADFWRVPSFAALAAAARSGPVILVNVSTHRCDALIVRAEQVDVVALPELTMERARFAAHRQRRIVAAVRDHALLPLAERERISRELRDTLDYLWHAVGIPVLRRLGISESDRSWPRLWWCPTGPLSLLPLHAAQTYDPVRCTEVGVIDHVISSYTPTLRALATAARRAGRTPAGSMLVVAPAQAPSDAALPHAELEAAGAMRTTGVPTAMLAGMHASKAAVSAALSQHRHLHFAGHSLQDLREPAQSRLRLADGDLTLAQIAALDLHQADLAYLSSCEGSTGAVTLPDESLHLAGALQLAGYRHVVAASWSVPDSGAAAMAAEIYQKLAALDATAAPSPDDTVAMTVHYAARRMRADNSPLVWASYLHIGP